MFCGSIRNLYGKVLACKLPFGHSPRVRHRAITVGGNLVYWDGAASHVIPPRTP